MKVDAKNSKQLLKIYHSERMNLPPGASVID